MANSKYEYVRAFERPDRLLPSTFIVVRIDGHGFHRFSDLHGFAKPNDGRALDLMNAAAAVVMRQMPDVRLAYGVSDEFSFVFRPATETFDRREAKLTTTVVSLFTGAYITLWPRHMGDAALRYAPSFDGRAVLYPTVATLRDYLNWRQVDCHINNLYNTTFWALQQRQPVVRAADADAADADAAADDGRPTTAPPRGSAEGGLYTAVEAEARLRGTLSSDKHEILFREYGVNYNAEADMFKKGSILVYDDAPPSSLPASEETGDAQETAVLVDEPGTETAGETEKEERKEDKRRRRRKKKQVVVLHVDLIRDAFWQRFPDIWE